VVRRRADGVEEGGAELEKARELLGVVPRRLRGGRAEEGEVGREEALVDEFAEEDEREDVGDAGL